MTSHIVEQKVSSDKEIKSDTKRESPTNAPISPAGSTISSKKGISLKTKKKASSINDSKAYDKTIGGKLKLKSVDFKSSKGPESDSKRERSASEQLKERIKKKSDRYAMVTFQED